MTQIGKSRHNIRDRLWDEAHRLGGFEDRAYKEARHRLNAAIRMGHWITLPVFLFHSSDESIPQFSKSGNAALQKAIDGAYAKFADVLVNYLMNWTASGVAVQIVFRLYAMCRFVFYPFRSLASWFRQFIGQPVGPEAARQWVGSREFAKLSAVERRADFGRSNCLAT